MHRRTGVPAKRGGALHRAAAAGRAPRGAVRPAGLPVPRVVPVPREPNVGQQPGRVLRAVPVPPGTPQRVCAVYARIRRQRFRRVGAVEPRYRGGGASAPEPPSPPVVHRRRPARLQAAGTEQGGPRLSAVPDQAVHSVVSRTSSECTNKTNRIDFNASIAIPRPPQFSIRHSHDFLR